MHSEDNFERPLEFIPERWLVDPETLDNMKRSFIAFSAGVRACPGMK